MAGGPLYRPVIVDEKRSNRFILPTALLSSTVVALSALMILDPAAGASTSSARPVDMKNFVERPPDVDHEVDFPSVLDSAASWLVKHQYEEGSWSASGYMQMCPDQVCLGAGREEHSLSITALAVLALIESGMCDPKRTRSRNVDFRAAAAKGVKWLLRQMDESSCCGRRDGRYVLGHAMATLALARWSTVTYDALDRWYAHQSLKFLLGARARSGGWRYATEGGESDATVTGWAMAAVDACRRIGIAVPAEVDGAVATWLDDVTDPLNYRTGYRARGERGWKIAGVNDGYDDHETNSAIALQIRMSIGQPPTAAAASGAVRRIASDLPYRSREGTSVDYLYWYHGTNALARHQAPHGDTWKHWNQRALDAILPARRYSACYAGSWDPTDRWGSEGGRVYATALNMLTLAAIERAR